ncbi:HEAT repeat domain-containing protein [Micromonospora sp. C28SCA-DRY-2]|uniref:HEAT repeat domain-containing protein n=1 Tax=Micromonospora sp. C28SCA-DRY-2 TaxID=3059522 RepID=UPI0026756E21|nr:HEAT repeat domain-containing protein [Micromonospora sp. C28SCA-DRY-2]MDO3701887.1 HEAT repeat domain-containing protein [Micromonospora sp. C28SCA-DRY-2]
MRDQFRELTDPDREVRLEALRALVAGAEKGDVAAKQVLREIVTGYPNFDPEIYSRALNLLALFGDESLAEALLAALADEEYGCQRWAATGCGILRLQTAAPLLIDLLRHPDALARESACEALGEIRDPTAITPLAQVLDDPAEHVRAAAAYALADIGDDEAIEHLWAALESPRRPVRAGYLSAALAHPAIKTFDRLIQATSHDDPEVRFWAARALGATGDERAEKLLTRLAVEDHATVRTGGHVSTAAKKALKTLRNVRKHQRKARAGEQTT